MQNIRYEPKTVAQKAALDSRADILLFGGAAGSLKTTGLILDAAQEHDLPRLRGVIFRKSYPELEEIIAQSYEIYPHLGAVYNESKHLWKFPAGGSIRFRFIESDKDKFKYQGIPYSFIGFDESTHFKEEIIRYLYTRARSTDPNMKVRMRLASNPGNEGHDWHFKMFLRGACFHCSPKESAIPGKLYYDAVWPSDKTPLSTDDVKVSVAFIPGLVTEHELFGNGNKKYIQQLNMQNPVTAKALLAGCWLQFEGQYFTIWEPNRAGMPMVMNWQDIGYEWWWPHWIGCDYGFTISAAAAGLYCRRPPFREKIGPDRFREWPKGRAYKLSEIVERRADAPQFADMIVKKWILGRDGSRIDRRIQAMYLSPDAGKNIGVVGQQNIHTIKDQMNAVLAPYDLAFTNAANDRIGGAMHMYSMLKFGELVICRNCTKTVEMIPSRIHDVDKENDVLKIKGSDLDDVYDECLARGTLVLTEHGERPIEDIRRGEMVWTRRGLRRVLYAWQSGTEREVCEIALSDGRTVTGTANHPFWVEGKGWMRLDELRYGAKLYICHIEQTKEWKPWSSMESLFAAILTRRAVACARITIQAGNTPRMARAHYIRKFGNFITVQFRKVMTFTMRMEILETIGQRILSQNMSRSICATTVGREGKPSRQSNTWIGLGPWPRHGMDRRKEDVGTLNTQRKASGRSVKRSNINASSVRRVLFQRQSTRELDSAPTLASQRGGAKLVWTWLREFVCGVRRRFRSGNMLEPLPVQDLAPHIIGGQSAGRADTFNLEVEGENEYFANGVLVHNCRYSVYSPEFEEKEPLQEKMLELESQGLDQLSLQIRKQQVKMEVAEEESDDPVIYGGKALRDRLDRNKKRGSQGPWRSPRQ